MQTTTKIFLLAGLSLISSLSFGQDQEYSFSLEEAKAYAVDHSYQSRLSNMEVEKSKKKVNEILGTGLPQVNASASYKNYLELPVQLVPAESFGGKPGEFVEFVFGTEQQMGLDITASQLIFNGSYFVGLQASKVYLELSKNDRQKSEIEIQNMVVSAYGTVLVSKENILILKDIYTNLEQNFEEAEALYKEGFISEEDKDQLELLFINAKNSFQQAERQLPIAQNQFKFILGIPFEAKVTLKDSIPSLLEQLPNSEFLDAQFDVQSHIDYKIVSTQLEGSRLLWKQQQSNYLPSLNAFFTYQENSYSNEFNFFSDSRWFPTQLVGLNLSVPIFSGLSKHNRVQQAKIDMQKVELARTQVEQQLKIQADKAKSDYLFAFQQYENRKENLDLAERIYKKTEIKYREGISSSTDLTQTNNQLIESQGNYIQASLQLINAKAELNRALNIN